MKKKKHAKMEAYEAPKVEVIEVQVERGFAATGDLDDYGYGGNLTNP